MEKKREREREDTVAAPTFKKKSLQKSESGWWYSFSKNYGKTKQFRSLHNQKLMDASVT